MQFVQIIAASSFILFGLWTIRGDTLDGEDKKPSKFGPIMTVAIAFFIAEMGDKTQLATVALAAKYPSPLATLMGITTGMMIADGLHFSAKQYLTLSNAAILILIVARVIYSWFPDRKPFE